MTKQQHAFLWGGLAVIVGLIVWGIVAVPVTPTTNGGSVPGITEADHVLGPKDAPVVLIEYSDFQCPACAASEPVVKQVKEKYGDQVTLVYRHFPLPSHQFGRLAAESSEAAHLQGKFWEFHDLLFERQSSWSREKNAKNKFIEYAGELGLNAEQFKTDIDSGAVNSRISADVQTGTAANIPGTPTFFLNGEQIQNPGSLSGFSSLIDQILSSRSNANARPS